jgi:hypothetical protein
MKCAAAVGLSLVLTLTPLAAQDKATPSPDQKNLQPTTNFTIVLPAVTSCPVSMHALQGSGSSLVAVRGTQRVTGFAQRIHLIVSDPKSTQVAAARVKVFGHSGKGRLEKASTSQELSLDTNPTTGPLEVTRTLEVTFVPEDAKDAATDLLLPGFTAVTSIQLESITYEDGTTWSMGRREACRVAPDPLMLVAAH